MSWLKFGKASGQGVDGWKWAFAAFQLIAA
jgi:hypothetical protein